MKIEEAWAMEIAEDIKMKFGQSVNSPLQIDKGWLNVKWKMDTEQGSIFVKFYYPDRYKLHLHTEKKTA